MAISVRKNVNELIWALHRRLLGCASGSLDFARDDEWGSRHRQSCKNPLDNRLARNRLCFRFVANDNAMTQDIGADALDVLRGDVAASVQESMSTRGQREINCGARGGSVTNQTLQLQVIRRRLPCRPNNVDDVILYSIVYVNVVHDIARCDDVLRIDHR